MQQVQASSVAGSSVAQPKREGTARERLGRKSPLRRMLSPPPPPPKWCAISAGILIAGMGLLALLLVMGYRQHGWPAHYLQDYQPGTWLSGGCLGLSALICFGTARRCDSIRRRRFWVLAGATLVIVSADDLLRLHEQLGAVIDSLATSYLGIATPLHAENWIVASYGMVALWYGWRRRNELLRLPWTSYCLGAAFVLFCGMVAIDMAAGSATIEESLKTIAALLIMIGCLAAYLSPELKEHARRG